MRTEQMMVRDFHRKLGFTINDKPTIIDIDLGTKRIEHTLEEVDELTTAVFTDLLPEVEKLVMVADALGDMIYFTLGTAVAYGIDMEPIMKEIHRSNMTKSRPVGGGDQKAVKGPNYSPPRLDEIIEAQIAGRLS